MAPATPRSADQVTLEWLNNVLFSQGELEGAVATDFDISVIGDGAGFLGDLCRHPD